MERIVFKKFKCTLAYVICAVMVLSSLSVGWAEQNENVDITYETNTDIFDDFEGMTTRFDVSGSLKCENIKDNLNNKALSYNTKNSGIVCIGKHFKNKLKPSTYKFSFDYYSGTTTSGAELRLLNNTSTGVADADNSWLYALFTSEKCLEIHRKSSKTTGQYWIYDASLDYKYDANKWYHIETFIDTENKELSLFINDDKVVVMPLDENYVDFHGIAVRLLGGSEETTSYIDNMEFAEMSDFFESNLSPVYVSATAPDGTLGNNFTVDNPICFETVYKNRSHREISAKLYYTVRTRDNEIIETNQNETDITVLGQDDEIQTQIKPKRQYFGRLDLELSAEVGGRTYTKVVPYTMTNRSKDMPNNQNFGINAQRGKFYNDIDILNIAGIGSMRYYLTQWQVVEKQKGVYVFPEEYSKRLDYLKENNIFLLNQFGNGNNAVYPNPDLNGHPEWNYLFPVSDEALKALENYMTALAKYADGRMGALEIWNEYNNMSGPYKQQYKYNVNLHRAIWNGIKKGDPNLSVSGIDTDTWGILVSNELKDTLDLMNGEQLFDNISIHPYHMTQGTPEVGGSVKECVEETKRLLLSHGYNPNMNMHMSEIGWSEYRTGSRQKQAIYIVRNQALCYSLVPDTRVYHYCLHDLGEFNNRTNPTESKFGIVEDYADTGAGVPSLGKEAFVAIGYFNNLMANCGAFENITEKLGFKNDDAYVYKTVTRNGENLIMLGSVLEKEKTFNLYLGCEKVVVGDTYGNEKTLFGIDGKFMIPVGAEEIAYIRGSFDKVESFDNRDKLFSFSDSEKTIPIDYDFSISLKAPLNFKGKVKAYAQGVDLDTDEKEINNGSAVVDLKSRGEINDNAFVRLSVYDKDDNLFFEQKIPVKYSTSATITNIKWRPVGTRTDLWNIAFDILNIRGDRNVRGEIKTVDGASFKIPVMSAGEMRNVSVPMPKINSIDELWKFSGNVELSTGEIIPIEIDETITGAQRARKKPTIDGVISDNEWDVGFLKLDINKESQVFGPNKKTWSGPDDASMNVYLKYDDDNFYIAAIVKDDIFRQVNPVDKMWNGDSLQVLIGFNKQITGTQYGIGLADGNKPAVFRNMQEENFGGWEGKDATGEFRDGEVAIGRNGVYTVYEASFPWDKIKLDPVKVMSGQTIYFSVLYNDDDGNDRENWIEYANNCIGGGANNNSDAVEAILLP